MDPWALAFTILMGTLWVVCFLWAWQTRRYLAFVLVIASCYAYWSEFGAIRLGTYYYDKLILTAGGAAMALPGWVPPSWLSAFVPLVDLPPGCSAGDYVIPIGVLSMEGVLLLSVFRTSHMLGLRWWVAPFLDALIAVDIDALLDPIGAHMVACAPGSGQAFNGLSFWVWRATDRNPGFFYGIPLTNYLAWFIGVFAFSFAIRYVAKVTDIKNVADTYGPPGPPNVGSFFQDFPPAAVAVVLLVLFEAAIAIPLRALFYLPGHEGSLAWQAGILICIFIISILVIVIFRRPLKRDADFVWPLILPQLAFPLFSLYALFTALWAGRQAVLPVGIVSTVLSVFFAFAPYKKFWALLGFPPPPPGPPLP